MNSLRQYLMDDVCELEQDEQEAALSDYQYLAMTGLYNVFGFMYQNHHLILFYDEHKDAIREELAELADAGLSVRDSIDFFRTHWNMDRMDHADWCACAIAAACVNAARELLLEVNPESIYA